MFQTILGVIGSLILEVVKGLTKFLSSPPLWLKVGGVSVRRTDTKITELKFNLEMVNESPSRPIRIDGVTLELPDLELEKFKHALKVALGIDAGHNCGPCTLTPGRTLASALT